MLEQESHIRAQLGRERRDRIASDYRLAQRREAGRTADRAGHPPQLLGRLWRRARRHVPAYHH